jgi:hypothetical protein
MNVKAIKEFEIGSSVFFGVYNDYKSKDIDLLNLTDKPLFAHHMMNMKIKEKDIFFMPLEDKSIMVEKTLTSGVPMRVGKFLVPEFAEYIGLTISDLKRLEPMFEQLDDKHKYEKIIYDSYVENDSFVLTEEQRRKAYEEYKRERDLS